MKRFPVLVLASLCLASAGCVEGDVVYTVNPDGSAKVRMDVTTVAPPMLTAPLDPNSPQVGEESLDDKLRNAIRGTLESPTVVAWKDVSAKFLPNGKLKFTGTAYLRQVSDFNKKGSFPLLSPPHSLERTPDGAMKLTRKADTNGNGEVKSGKRKPKTPEQIKKLTDEQLDDEILRELIDLQSGKSVLAAVLTDCKLKTAFVLPGEPTQVTGFARDGRTVSWVLDGSKILANLDKALSEDRATWRKWYRDPAGPNILKNVVFGDAGVDGTVTVAKPGEPLFDFDKEVKEARAAYPALRKKLGFGENLRLPTGDATPKKPIPR